MKQTRLFAIISALIVIGIFSISEQQAQAQSDAIKITDAIPATSQIGEIFRTSFTVNYTDGRLILAGNEEGTGLMTADDHLFMSVTRPDNTVVTYSRLYDASSYSPTDITNYFQQGENFVEIRIENVSGVGEASAHWLVSLAPSSVTLPFNVTEEIPTFAPKSGSFFGRYFYVDYNGNGRLLLSANAEGQGITSVTNRLEVHVWRPDGTYRIYVRDSSPLSAMDLTDYFQAGRNLVHVRLENSDPIAGSKSIWLVQLPKNSVTLPLEITKQFPAQSPPTGDIFGRYFWLQYTEGENIFLASTADGSGILNITGGTLYIRVVHSDGSQVRYVQGSTIAPVDLSAYFAPGWNLVQARIYNPSGVIDVSSLFLSDTGTPLIDSESQSVGWAKEITQGFPYANRGDGTDFFDQQLELDYRAGEVILSALSNGQGVMSVDDLMLVDIVRPDGTTSSFTRSGAFSPLELTDLLQIGQNTVRVRLRETINNSSSSSLWFYNLSPIPVSFPYKFTDAMPYLNRGDGIDFLTKQAYVDYDGNGILIFSAFSDGTGNISTDDLFKIWIRHPDGTTRYYQYSGLQPPLDLTSLFAIGRNYVRLALHESVNNSSTSAIWLSQMNAISASTPFQVTEGFPYEDRGDGIRYFGRHFFITSSGLNTTTLAQFADATGNIAFDDQMVMYVERPDGSTVSKTISGSSAPYAIDQFLNIGLNRVVIYLQETVRNSSASAVWLSQRGPSPTPIPTATSTHTSTPCPTEEPIPVPGGCATITPTSTPTPSPTLTPTPTSTPRATPSVLPAITTIRPNQGSTTEPNVINVRGRNFQDGATVRLGDLALTTTFVDATYLRADVPAGLSAGVYNITVTNPDGGQATLTHGYTVFDAATNDDLFGYDYELVTDPAAPLAGSPAQLRLKVHRQGGKQALANVKVRFYLGDPQHGGTLIGDGTIAALSPGASNNTSGVAWTPAAPGDATIYAVIDPENSVAETYEDNNVVQRTLTVLPPAADTVAPHVDSFTINDGAATTTERAVTLHVTASDAAPGTGIAKVLFVEFEFSQGAGDWAPVRVSEWLDYAAVQNGHTWSLVPASGMKYLQAWVADGAGNIALFPAKAFINFLPPLQRVAQNQRQSYRFPLEVGEVLSVRLEAVSGDPDLYIWAPDYTTRAPWVSNLRDSVDDLAITAPVAGNYQVEVHGFSAAEYRLLVVINPTELNAAAALGGQDPSKPLPSTPLSGNSEPASQFALNTPGAIDQRLYLPLIRR